VGIIKPGAGCRSNLEDGQEDYEDATGLLYRIFADDEP
jgi:hypothetical protein